MTETVTETGRSAGISYDELFEADTHPVSEVLRRVGTVRIHKAREGRVEAAITECIGYRHRNRLL